jgi:glucose uptake protein GlcU
MPASKPTPPQIDLAQDWLEYSAQNHGQRLEVLRFSFAASVAVLVLIGSFLVVTDRRQHPDLQKLAIGLIGTVVGASLTPLRRD